MHPVPWYLTWRTTSFEERARLMRAAGQVLRDERERFAALMTAEMGKTIAEARSEVTKCAWVCDYYADHAEEFLTPRQIATDASLSLFVAYGYEGSEMADRPVVIFGGESRMGRRTLSRRRNSVL